MAEMTVATMVEWLTADKAVGQECYSRKQIAALIQQQAATIEAMKCCGNCANWLNKPEKMSCKLLEIDVAQWCRCGEWQVKEGQ